MPRMSLAWIEAQIEQELDRGNSPDAVRDLAALLEVRRYMLEQDHAHDVPASTVRDADHRSAAAQHDDVLDTAPTIEQIEAAVGAVAVHTAADRKRLQDAMTWMQILKGDES